MTAEIQSLKQILVVEDDEATRLALTRILRGEGYTADGAASAEEALERLGTAPLPDLVLLDWVLPGLNGRQFLERIRRDPDRGPLPVAVLSGFPEKAEQPSEFRGITCLTKPVDTGELFATVAQLTASRRPEVLLVEDDERVRDVLSRGLHNEGFGVRPTRDGNEAAAVFRRHQATVRVVLLDVQMPAPNGPQTLGLLRRIDPGVRCVFMSGNTGNYSDTDLLALGAVHVLPKPVGSLQQVANLLRQVIETG
jgi:CheY-like chemotaxis protein